MATLDSLPPDQRAVLTLVLQRGHSFDDIAELLSIDRAAVRERALGALDALGPETELDAGRRALITDYLLGQLPPRVADTVRDGLGSSPPQRAWARVLAADLAPLASQALPEIPSGSPPAAAERGSAPATGASEAGLPGAEPPSSRLGGAILLGIGLLIAVVVVVVILVNSGGSSKSSSTQASVSSTAAASTASASATATSGSATSSAKPVAQVNLRSPSGNSKIAGVAIVVKQGLTEGLVIRASGVPANNGHDAYAVWLSNGAGDERILGFVNPGVTATGVLQTAGALPANASHFKQLLVTRELTAKPTSHGPILLQGALSLTG